jgi:hypothetical protein
MCFFIVIKNASADSGRVLFRAYHTQRVFITSTLDYIAGRSEPILKKAGVLCRVQGGQRELSDGLGGWPTGQTTLFVEWAANYSSEAPVSQ